MVVHIILNCYQDSPPFSKGGTGGIFMLPYRRDLKNISRHLRNNLTVAEIKLWSKLRGKQINGVHFYRQKYIGNYIVDFYCPSARLIIEIDGSQHFIEEGKSADCIRDNYLSKLGFTVLRFNNNEVLTHIDGVVESIYNFVVKNPPPPPFRKEGGLAPLSPRPIFVKAGSSAPLAHRNHENSRKSVCP
jgi:very-short-patch-repair endonuclease